MTIMAETHKPHNNNVNDDKNNCKPYKNTGNDNNDNNERNTYIKQT